jgi:outer membrane protein TolC
VLGLGIGIPVWGGNQALVNSIDKKIMREQIEFDYQKRMIENELQQALTSYQFTRKQIKLYQPFEINDLEDKFNRLERDFRKELIDLLTYIELDKQIAETVSMTFQAQMDVVNAISKITNLTGRDDLPELLMNQ